MSTPSSSRLRDRSTADLVVLGFTLLIGVVIVSTVVGGVIWKISDPDADIGGLAARVGDLTNTLIGAVVGYIAGKGAGAAMAAGGQAWEPEPPHQDGEGL